MCLASRILLRNTKTKHNITFRINDQGTANLQANRGKSELTRIIIAHKIISYQAGFPSYSCISFISVRNRNSANKDRKRSIWKRIKLAIHWNFSHLIQNLNKAILIFELQLLRLFEALLKSKRIFLKRCVNIQLQHEISRNMQDILWVTR